MPQNCRHSVLCTTRSDPWPCFVQHKLKVGDLQRNINAKNFQNADDTIVYDHAYISDICPGICQPWINALSVWREEKQAKKYSKRNKISYRDNWFYWKAPQIWSTILIKEWSSKPILTDIMLNLMELSWDCCGAQSTF